MQLLCINLSSAYDVRAENAVHANLCLCLSFQTQTSAVKFLFFTLQTCFVLKWANLTFLWGKRPIWNKLVTIFITLWWRLASSEKTAFFTNRTIARWRYLTTTARTHFVFTLLFKFGNSAENKRTIALICTKTTNSRILVVVVKTRYRAIDILVE